ncbi:MAG TPA: Hsp70 family protein, partial [Spirochaetota bacterium]|nr:Hsp70 family protein [Spirochaetota bacterium]
MEDNVALPKSIGIKLFDDSFVPVLSEGEIKNKKVILTTVKDNQKKAIIELYEGNSDRCVNNEYLGKLVISIDRQTNKGEPGIEVHLRLDENGMLYAKAWDVESGQETA